MGRCRWPSRTSPRLWSARLALGIAVGIAAAGVATAKAIGDSMVAGGVVACLAAVLPDLDHPRSAVGRLLPRWWHRLTPGHYRWYVWPGLGSRADHRYGALIGHSSFSIVR